MTQAAGPLLTVGLATFGYPPVYRRRNEGGAGEAAKNSGLAGYLGELGARVSACPREICTAPDLRACVDEFRAGGIDCLVVELFHWTRIPLVVSLIKALDVPTALVANTTGHWNGIPAVTAVSGSLRELSLSRNVRLVERFRDSRLEDLRTWLRAIAALQRMRRSRLMCFGGFYGAEMPYTRSDPAALESLLIEEIMTEQEQVIVEAARAMLRDGAPRVQRFGQWLSERGTRVEFDAGMLTPEALQLQTAMYLAVKDRLSELEEEGIAGVSIKCHFEVSTTCVGCTECLTPAFLPFGIDAEGEKPVLPVACEGDLNGLVSLVLLHSLNPEVPPLFGDFVYYGDDHILMRNCGASSVYWAGMSADAGVSLPRVRLRPNIHGGSGGAVHYETPAVDAVTMARLARTPEGFVLFAGAGRVKDPADSSYPDPWPHTRLFFDHDAELFFKTAPCNHASLTTGDWMDELAVFCRHTGIELVRCDGNAALAAYLERLGG